MSRAIAGRNKKPVSSLSNRKDSVPETSSKPAKSKSAASEPASSQPKSVKTGSSKGRPSRTKSAKPATARSTTEDAKKSALTKKRPLPDDPTSKPAKKLKTHTLNTPPNQRLDVYVCGDGESGELGLGSKSIDGLKPAHVKRPRLNKLLDSSVVGVVQVAAGGMHCVSLTQDQKIVTWGVNDDGALGRDTNCEAPTRDVDEDSDSDDEIDLNPAESTPTAIPTASFGSDAPIFSQVVALDSASFALTSAGTVYGWGTFRGSDGNIGFTTKDAIKSEQLKGNDKAEKKLQRQPLLIQHLTKIVSLAAGSNHVLALDSNGKVFAWGAGEQSQLGRHILEKYRPWALTPCRVALPKIKEIACGAYHCFAIDQSGLVYAWGSNNFGQTGIRHGAGEGDAFVPKPLPVESLRPYKIREIQGGEHHSIACTEDGGLLIWGRCDDGQAGINLDSVPKDKLIFDERGKPRIIMPSLIPDIQAVSVAAGIDNSFAITADGKAYSWGFSENYRSGQGRDDTVREATLVKSADVNDKKLTYAGCGGQFSILAGPTGH